MFFISVVPTLELLSFIYLFTCNLFIVILALLDPCCWVQAFSSCEWNLLSSCDVCASLAVAGTRGTWASVVAEHGLTSCGEWV